MQILENYDLTKLNTLGVSACAREFVEINSEGELKEVLSLEKFKQSKKMFLGGGSNVLFTRDFDGMVVLNKLEGISEIPRGTLGKNEVLIRAMSGVVWHDLVSFAVERNYWGIE